MIKLLAVCCASLFASAALSNPLILQPEINPAGDEIAFSYQGDIWTVDSTGGRANRLTIHEGYESMPKWSADSNLIAFSSDRFGNNDIYTMPSTGGLPTRLTFHSASDRVTSFTPDNQILFNSRRTYAQVERESEILAVDAKGNKTESRFMDALGFDAVVSPDGKKVAFVRGTCRVSREAYRGPANRNIWIYDTEKETYTQLTTFDGNDFMPIWVDSDTLYFISARSGKYNVHQADLNKNVDARFSQITEQTKFGINHFSTSKDGKQLVFQAGNDVYSLDTVKGRQKDLKIEVSADFRFDPEVTKNVSDKLDQYAVSPNGKLTAYVHRGDIYVTRNNKREGDDDKRSVRLSYGWARDRDPVWLNDNALIFVSDREGQNDLFLIKSNDANQANLFKSLKHSITRLTKTKAEEFDPVISPDGNKIAFRQDRGVLVSAEISDEGKLSKLKTLLDGWDIPSKVSWSPDSVWLAYSLSDINFNEDVYIHAADNSQEPVNISMHPKYDSNPIWSPDGSKLGFISNRNNGDFDVWFAWLSEEDWQRSQEEWRRMDKDDKPKKSDAKSKQDEDKGDDDKNKEEQASKPIRIDFEGMYKRLQQVTSYAGNETEMAFDAEGEHIYFATGGAGRQNFKTEQNLFKVKWDGDDKKAIISGNREPELLSLSNDGKSLYVLTKGGKLVSINAKNDKNTNLAISSQVKINYAKERAQIFDEGWRALNAGFYDPQFHGQDWQELHKKYRPIALNASTKEDFQYIFNQMLGQLNASHMGMFRGENQKSTQRQRTGLLGIEGKHTRKGFEVLSVLPNSPADRLESKILVGDLIEAVDQKSIKSRNFYASLTGKVNSPVLLSLKRKGKDQEIVIWPTNSLSNQLYDDWVETRRQMTTEFSNGRLGYLHIRGMNWTSFERFERELMAAGYGKEGIVIDVRYNGGGWTTDYLMAVLNVKQHSYTIPRGASDDVVNKHQEFKDAYPFAERLPLSAWTKPSIAMSNENSYSNAEIFSHAYKALGIGKLVGRPTFGAVISTGGYQLVDGTLVRMPFRGWWVKESGANMERVPAVPDIEVFNPPAYKTKQIDPQLKRAVDELISDL